QVDVADRRKRTQASSGSGIRSRQRRINIPGEQIVNSARVRVVHRDHDVLRQLAIDADRRLNRIRRLQMGIDLTYCLRKTIRVEHVDPWDSGEESREGHDELLLRNSVEPQSR